MVTNIVSQCSTCNGACCKIFSLDHSRRDLIKWIFTSKKKRKYKNKRIEFIRQLLWLKDITNTPLGIEVKKQYSFAKYLYTCKKLKNGKCSVYSKRLEFCYNYNCHGSKQFAHIEFNGQQILPQLNQFKDDEVEVKVEALSEV